MRIDNLVGQLELILRDIKTQARNGYIPYNDIGHCDDGCKPRIPQVPKAPKSDCRSNEPKEKHIHYHYHNDKSIVKDYTTHYDCNGIPFERRLNHITFVEDIFRKPRDIEYCAPTRAPRTCHTQAPTCYPQTCQPQCKRINIQLPEAPAPIKPQEVPKIPTTQELIKAFREALINEIPKEKKELMEVLDDEGYDGIIEDLVGPIEVIDVTRP